MPNKSSPHGGYIQEGSISTGTLRTPDLLLSFAVELERVSPFNGRSLATEAREAAANYPRGNEMQEHADWVLDELVAQLNDIASREGMVFGAHPGDGADFGYWKESNDDAA